MIENNVLWLAALVVSALVAITTNHFFHFLLAAHIHSRPIKNSHQQLLPLYWAGYNRAFKIPHKSNRKYV